MIYSTKIAKHDKNKSKKESEENNMTNQTAETNEKTETSQELHTATHSDPWGIGYDDWYDEKRAIEGPSLGDFGCW